MRTIKLDQLNATLSIDGWTAEELSKLAPHKSVFDLNAPRMVSRNLSMPKPVVATIADAVHSVDAKRVDPDKALLMAQIPECPPYFDNSASYATAMTQAQAPVIHRVVMDVLPTETTVPLKRRATDYVRRATDKVPDDK